MQSSSPLPHHLPPGFIQDQSYGWLMPHQAAMSALGVISDYHLRKNFNKLLPGTHLIKRQDPDHINRLYYTIEGLKLLCELVRSPQSYQFAHQLQNLESFPLPALPAYGQGDRPSSPLTLYQGEVLAPPTSWQEPVPPTSPSPLTSFPTSPSEMGLIHPDGLPPHQRSSSPVISSDAEAIANIIFKGQELTRDSMLNAQKQQVYHTQFSIDTAWKRADDFLERQDSLTVALLGCLLVALVGIGGFSVASSLRSPSQPSPPAAIHQR